MGAALSWVTWLFGPTQGQVDQALRGKVAVITGASQGLGAELAKQLASHGCNVVISSRSAERLAKRVELITTALGDDPDGKHGKVFPVVADISIGADCARLVKQTLARFGKMDYMVNNW
jgi:3-oxoacyl-[acyl-carrier protein] reductase